MTKYNITPLSQFCGFCGTPMEAYVDCKKEEECEAPCDCEWKEMDIECWDECQKCCDDIQFVCPKGHGIAH